MGTIPAQLVIPNAATAQPLQGQIVVGMLITSLKADVEIEFAPDTGSLAPDTGNSESIRLQKGNNRFFNIGLTLGAVWWHRWRHVRIKHTAGAWTEWLAATADVLLPGMRVREVPSYPAITVTTEQPATQLGSALIRFASWPEHDDLEIRYAYLEVTDSRPPQSKDSNDWTLWDGEDLLVNRKLDANRVMLAYGDINSIVGETAGAMVGPDLRAQFLSSTRLQVGDAADAVGCALKRTIEVDSQTVEVELYRKVDAWPTLDGLRAGTVDPLLKRGRLKSPDWSYQDGKLGDGIYQIDAEARDVWLTVDQNGKVGTRSTTDDEDVGTGTGGTTNFTGTLADAPLIPATLELITTEGTPQRVFDDGRGNLVGPDIGSGTNTIDYATGAFDVDFASNVGSGDDVLATYCPVGVARLEGVLVGEDLGGGGDGDPAIDHAWRSNIGDGTNCVSAANWREVRASWDLNDPIATDGNSDIRVKYRVNGSGWFIGGTESNPVGTTFMDFNVHVWGDPEGGMANVDLLVELIVGGDVIDTVQLDEEKTFFGHVCEVL